MKFLVTGGTGTFGRAFLSYVIDHGAERAVALGRHEAEMAQLESLLGHHSALRCFLGDVRDAGRLEMAMHNVDTVVHAAALKRIEQCERDPIEAVKTNIGGTTNVVDAALRAGVSKVVLLSTDKAVDPINLYGATKLTAERLILAANNISGGRCAFSVARYGNIWGSRGSVVHQWRRQIAEGNPIIVTDRNATRYFMLPIHAVHLVTGLIRRMKGGEIELPKLRAYQLNDLIVAMRPVAVKLSGLPNWEKLHETMDGFTDSGQAERMTVEELLKALEDV
jgi:UDP-N-acetylglucosamine 4,6-dehydratase/5-epimerase